MLYDAEKTRSGLKRLLKSLDAHKKIENPNFLTPEDFYKIGADAQLAADINEAVIDFAVDDKTQQGIIRLSCDRFFLSGRACINFACLCMDYENLEISYDEKQQLCIEIRVGNVDLRGTEYE